MIAALKAAAPTEEVNVIVLQAKALVAGELKHMDTAIQTDLARQRAGLGLGDGGP